MQRKTAQSPESPDRRMSKTNADIQQKIMVPLAHFSPWNHDDALRPLAETQERWIFPSTILLQWNLLHLLSYMLTSKSNILVTKT